MILKNPLYFLPNSLDSSILNDNVENNSSSQPEIDLFNFDGYLSDINKEEGQIESIYMLKANKKDRQNTKEKFLFKTKLNNRKRGRKAIKQLGVKKYPEHSSFSNDNITSKIQNHFLTFLISFINDCVLSFPFNEKIVFLNFNYKEKSKASSKNLNKLKKTTIKDLLKNMNISDKYKRFNKAINKKFRKSKRK